MPPSVLFKRQEEPWIDIIPEKSRDTVSGKMMILFLRFFPFLFLFNRYGLWFSGSKLKFSMGELGGFGDEVGGHAATSC